MRYLLQRRGYNTEGRWGCFCEEVRSFVRGHITVKPPSPGPGQSTFSLKCHRECWKKEWLQDTPAQEGWPCQEQEAAEVPRCGRGQALSCGFPFMNIRCAHQRQFAKDVKRIQEAPPAPLSSSLLQKIVNILTASLLHTF